MKALNYFFEPKAVAVIGASHKPNKFGRVIFENFVNAGFGDKVIPVNVKGGEILGRKVYKSVLEYEGDLDLAVIVVPAKFVPNALEQCGEKKIEAAVIISGGFKETGKSGAKLEETIKEIIKKYGIRVIGPNCLGVFHARGVDTLFLPNYKLVRPILGGISFITQSGATGSAVLDWASESGIGIDKFVSYGNKADVDEVDILNYLKNDQTTKVIAMYIEGTDRGRELFDTVKKVSAIKPVIVLKAGDSEVGSRAVLSHTGSLAGSSRVFKAAMRQAGAIVVQDIDEMFDIARALLMQPLPVGDKVSIVTNGGGFGVLCADAIDREGLKLTELSRKTIADVKAESPSYAVIKNPMDLVGDADAKRYRAALKALIRDPNVDSLIVITLFQTSQMGMDVVDVVIDADLKTDKPILLASAGGGFTALARKLIEGAGTPTYPTPARAVHALAAVTKYAKYLRDRNIRRGA